MPQACRVCNHDERDTIDARLVEGFSKRSIARQFGLSRYSLERHAENHLSGALVAVREHERAATLLERVETLVERLERLADDAEAQGKAQQLLSAARELRETYRLVGHLTGELDERPQVTVNLLTSPEWLALRGAILQALRPHPDALQAVSEAVRELERGEAA